MAFGPKAKEWLKDYLRTPFVIIVWFMETFAANRQRVKDFMEHRSSKQVLSWTLVATGVIWVAIALFADDRHGERLDCAMENIMEKNLQEIECAKPTGS